MIKLIKRTHQMWNSLWIVTIVIILFALLIIVRDIKTYGHVYDNGPYYAMAFPFLVWITGMLYNKFRKS